MKLAFGVVTFASLISTAILSAQTLETETAQMLPDRRWETGAAFEVQTSRDGMERSLPLFLEYGIGGRMELVLEPIPYSAILPSGGRAAKGRGDTEATVNVLLRQESAKWPAFAIAGEVKFPTAKDRQIGTGKTDYTAWAIATRSFGNVATHANIGYTVMGKLPGITINNVWSANFAAVKKNTGSANEIFGEVLGVTASGPDGESGDSKAGVAASQVLPPEVAGAELVGTLGIGRTLSAATRIFVSVSYDNQNDTLLRLGFTLKGR